MFKKVLIVGALVTLVGAVLFGRDAVTYVSMGIDEIREHCTPEVPVEYEIKQAKRALADLEPEIRKSTESKYREAVRVNRLEKQIASAEDKLNEDEMEIKILAKTYQDGEQYVTFGGREFTNEEVAADLERRFERFQVAESTLNTNRAILKQRQEVLHQMGEKLAAMKSAKEQLKLEIENLEAKLAAVEVAKARSEFSVDDSELSKVRQLVDKISERIEVDAAMLEAETDAYPEIPVLETESGELLDRIEAHFGGADTAVADN